ncbi:type II toxin-antitoxin system RelE/ParE family toxin [Bacteroidota bacterium]
MIRSFMNRETEDVFNGTSTANTRRLLPEHLVRIALRKLEQLDSVERLSDLRIPPGNRLESLRGSRAGEYSIRINDKYRVCFAWSDLGPDSVEIVDYH